MHDIKFIKNKPEIFDRLQKKRNEKVKSSEILEIYNKYLSHINKIQELQKIRNNESKKIGLISKIESKAKIDLLKKNVGDLKKKISDLNLLADKEYSNLTRILSLVPNLLDEKTPFGESDLDNKKIKEFGKKNEFSFQPLDHVVIGEKLGLLDYTSAAKLSGARFSVLKSELALLSRALMNYMLDKHTKQNGYKEIKVPELVLKECLYGTGQLPKFKDDLFETREGLWLIPTAEVSLTNLCREEILNYKNLPLRYTSFTNCFRSEAGSAGVDTKGLIREHQFGKVELVSITKPESSMNELDRMIECVESILKDLKLHYRVMELCSYDVGFSSSYTLDFEVWMPGQSKFREVSSCSNCKDFQSRRMKMRTKNNETGKIIYPHTLNGSGLAIGRIIVAILENFQEKNGEVNIPKVLWNYMGGTKKLLNLKD